MYQSYYYYEEITTREKALWPNYRYLYYSFIYTKGEKFGIMIDSNNTRQCKVVSVDSMLKKEWVNQIDLNYLSDSVYSKLISVKRNKSTKKRGLHVYWQK